MTRTVEFSKLILACAAACVFASTLYAQNAPAAQEGHGIAVANMDRSVKPGDDFYQYANGEWIKRTEIPPDRAGVGRLLPRSPI